MIQLDNCHFKNLGNQSVEVSSKVSILLERNISICSWAFLYQSDEGHGSNRVVSHELTSQATRCQAKANHNRRSILVDLYKLYGVQMLPR